MKQTVTLSTQNNRLFVAAVLVLFASGFLPSKAYAAEISTGFEAETASLAAFTPQALAAGRSNKLRDRGVSLFAAGLSFASPDLPVGLFVPDVMAFPVVQQPKNNPAYVAPADGVLTHFGLAAGYGSTGLLAHNTAAGAQFSKLLLDQMIYLVRGDKSIEAYKITEIRRFRALQPTSPYSDFIDIDQPGVRLTATDLFYQVYAGDGHVTLQTCITADGLENWGRLFLIAEPVEPDNSLHRLTSPSYEISQRAVVHSN